MSFVDRKVGEPFSWMSSARPPRLRVGFEFIKATLIEANGG
jgi:hypothetical protein